MAIFNNDDLLRALAKNFKAFAYQKITVNATVKSLTIPRDAKYALLSFETDATGISARFLETNVVPVSATDGIALSHLDRVDITDTTNLEGFQIVQAQSGIHTLHVQYYY
jgi:hypothetical protein